MSKQYCIATDVLAAGTMLLAPLMTRDFVFHPGPNEVRLTAKGMTYRGELVEDAGAAYAALMNVMNVLHHPQQVGNLATNLCVDENNITVDRRDLFDSLRSAWRDGQDHAGTMDEAERWAKASDHATETLRSWGTAGGVHDFAAREKALQAENAQLATLAKQNNADAEMYARAWQRELAGFLRPKGHHIDMLVVSTQALVDRCKRAERGLIPPVLAAGEELSTLSGAEYLAPSSDEIMALPPLGILIDQLEATEVPDPNLDAMIAREVGCIQAPVPRYTASFDAALGLIEPGRDYELTSYGSGLDGVTFTCAAMKWWPRPDDCKNWRSESGNKLSPALAMCIAALKVRLARSEEAGEGFKRSAA